MITPPKITFTTLLIALSSLHANADTLVWNVQKKYGITAEGVQQAVQAAKRHFRKTPNDQIVLEFDAGTFKLDGKDKSLGTIDLSGVKPGPQGRLVFKGAGIDKTTLVFSDNTHAISGRNVFRVTMSDMHMTRQNYTVSQGIVVGSSPGKVVLDIQAGFPTPMDIFNPQSDQGRYIRQYTNSKTDPQIVVENDIQLAWKTATHLGGQRWQLNLVKRRAVPVYAKGDLLGIKSKHGGQTYWFNKGSDFIFQSIKWTQKTRGVFRGAFDKIQILDCITDRSAPINGQTPCLVSPGGGTQIGQPWDPPTTGNIVRNCTFIASGDDAVAFFHGSGEISGCTIKDAFSRGILLANSPNTATKNNQLTRCPIQRSKDHIMPKDLNELMK